MAQRTIKTLMILTLGLSVLFYLLQNFANLQSAYEVISFVLSGQGHEYYTNTFGFFSSSPSLVWTALSVIFLFEGLAALCLLKGSFDLWRARRSDETQFREAKRWSIIGLFLGFFVWGFLFFGVGSAFFNMWQTEIGAGSLADSFKFATLMAVTLIFIAQRES